MNRRSIKLGGNTMVRIIRKKMILLSVWWYSCFVVVVVAAQKNEINHYERNILKNWYNETESNNMSRYTLSWVVRNIFDFVYWAVFCVDDGRFCMFFNSSYPYDDTVLRTPSERNPCDFVMRIKLKSYCYSYCQMDKKKIFVCLFDCYLAWERLPNTINL